MAKKTVIVTINHSPYNGNFCEEGLRTVIGTHISIEEQNVKTVFMGDGIYFGLRDVDQGDFQKYLKTIKSMQMDLYIEEESIMERKLQKDKFREDFKVIPRTEILKIFKEADHVLAF